MSDDIPAARAVDRLGPARIRRIIIAQTDPGSPAAAPLVRSLEAEYRALYGEEVARELSLYAASEFGPPTGAFLLATTGTETIAGGALRRWSAGVGEIKRMWTNPAHRGQGHGRRILAALEEVAARYGYRALRLETGCQQTAAIALYCSSGYRCIPGYRRYADDARSVSFEKTLTGGAPFA
jgi:GNAT superfamily N-acetyltransferase